MPYIRVLPPVNLRLSGSITDFALLEELGLSLPANGLVPNTILIQRNSNSVTMKAETVGAEVVFKA